LRFVITGEWNRNQLLRLILFFFLVYILLFWVTNWILYFQKMNLDPESVVTYFRGDPDAEFGQPARPLGALTEVSHYHLFAMGMLVMTLTHLLLFLPVPFRVKGGLTLLAFSSALLGEGSNWLVRFIHPGFAWLKVSCFLLFQAALLGLLVALIAGVLHPRRNAYADHDTQRRHPTNGWNPS
jgi:hypothetical protein